MRCVIGFDYFFKPVVFLLCLVASTDDIQKGKYFMLSLLSIKKKLGPTNIISIVFIIVSLILVNRQ